MEESEKRYREKKNREKKNRARCLDCDWDCQYCECAGCEREDCDGCNEGADFE